MSSAITNHTGKFTFGKPSQNTDAIIDVLRTNNITREKRSTCGLHIRIIPHVDSTYGSQLHMWFPYVIIYGPYMIIELNHMWTPHTEIIYGLHIRKSYTENHMWFSVYDLMSVYDFRENHMWTPHTVNHIR